MSHYVAFQMGLHCLKVLVLESLVYKMLLKRVALRSMRKATLFNNSLYTSDS